jgi:hypothetical protein
MANNGVYYSSGNSLNFTTNNTTWATLTSGGTFEISTVSATTYLNLASGNFTGGTVAGATNFTGGLSANTFSAATYENLPITGITSGTGISVTSTGGGGYQITNTNPDQTVVITGGTNIEIVSAYPNFGVNFTGTTSASGDYLPLSGGTVTGGTVFTSGVTANTISSVDYIDFDLLSGATAPSSVSRLRYVADEGGLVTTLLGGNVDLQIGQQNLVYCYNGDTVTLNKGQVVAIFGNQGNRPKVQRAIASAETTSSTALGVVSETIISGNEGFITTFGNVRGFNLTGITPGSYVYLSPTIQGAFTGTQPQAPEHIVAIGYVVRTGATQGEIFVNINNGWELNELHNVRITNPTQYDILQYSAGTSPVWYNTSSPFFSGLTATTISASTYNNLPGSSSSNCFTTFYVTNISGCSPVNILSPLNLTSGINVTGTTNFDFSGGLTASTVSATTFQNLPVSAVTNGSGISTSTSNGVVTVTNSQVQGITGKTDGTGISSSISNNVLTITNTDLGSSQNIFKNIQINGVTQFAANSNTSDLNFSGINVTITSAATNTLVFSAGTGGGGGGGGVTSVTAGSGLSGDTTTGAITLINTQVQGITGITAGSGISASTTNNVTTITQIFDYGKSYTTGNNLNFI